MDDPTQQAPPITPDPSQPDQTSNQDLAPQTTTQFMAFHNNNIIGFFETQADAVDALNGYQMSNVIDINDVADVYQVTLPAQ